MPDYKKIIYLYNFEPLNYQDNLITIPYKLYTYNNNDRPSLINIFFRFTTLLKIIKNENVKFIFSFSSQGALLSSLAKIALTHLKMRVIVRLGSVFNQMFSNPGGSKELRKVWEYITIKFTYKNVDSIVCTTKYMKNELLQHDLSLENKIIIIKNYLDTVRIDNLKSSSLKYKNKFILYIGRLEKEKNLESIIHAFKKVNKKIAVDFLIIGDGSYKKLLLEKTRELKLEHRINLVGYKSNPYKYMTKAECLILFSDFEGMPNVIIEALYCGLPVISSKFNGVEDMIVDGHNGLLVNLNDINGLSSSLLKLLNKDGLMKKFINNGQISASEYTKSLEKYNKLIQGNFPVK